MAFVPAFTERFNRAYKKLEPQKKKAVKTALVFLQKGKPYPNSLRVKKMQGTGKKSIMEASPTMDTRITFEFEKPDKIIFRNVGEHDITLSKP